jgi:hypothetical protein
VSQVIHRISFPFPVRFILAQDLKETMN